jgi:hypothetical protein
LKAYINFNKQNGLGKFLELAKSATRKLVYISPSNEADLHDAKAVAITGTLTMIGEGVLNSGDMFVPVKEKEPESDIFTEAGFVYVDKIEEGWL